MKKWEKFSDEELKTIVQNSISYREVSIKLGYSETSGGGCDAAKEMIESKGFNTDHFLGMGWNKSNFDYNRFQKGKAIKSAAAIPALTELRGYKCENCGNETWLGQLIPLEVHHLDGDKLNNELENLKLLCPNCHALTDNWRGKNINSKIKEPISEEQFVEALKNSDSIRQALLSLGLSAKGGNYDRAYKLIYKYDIKRLINKIKVKPSNNN